MPSAAVFVSNVSLNSANGSCRKPSNAISVDQQPQYTKEPGMSLMLLLTSMSLVISAAIPTGYHVGVMNSPQKILKEFCNETVQLKYEVTLTVSQLNLLWSVIVSVFLIGGMVGSLAAGSMCNKFGRKGACLIANLVGLFGSILLGACKPTSSIEMFIMARILVGLHSGFTTSGLTIYLAEISPARLRAQICIWMPLGISLGIVFSLICSLESILGTVSGWPYLLSLCALPTIFGSLILMCCPESPKYLYIVKGRSEQAMQELCRLRGATLNELDVDITEMKKELKDNIKTPSWSYVQLLTSRTVRMPLIVICILHIGNQLSGINAVFYYSTGIFRSAGLSQQDSQYASIGAGLTNLSMAFMATALAGRFRRRPLYITSCIMTMVCLAALTLSFIFQNSASFVPYTSIALLLMFVMTFGIGIGPIPFYIGSELFSPGPRASAMSVGCAVNWVCNFLVGSSFPTIQANLGDYSFTLFIGILFIICLFANEYMPETKDLTIDEIMAQFNVSWSSEPNVINTDIEDAAIIQPDKQNRLPSLIIP